MADQELIIKISGDPADYKAAVGEAHDATKEFKEGLSALAEIVAFAELTHKIHETIEAFHEQAKAIELVKAALQNQGLAGQGLAEQYEKTAEAIEKKTGVDAAQILTAQASAQALLGQKAITADLTRVVVDFAAQQRMGVAEAFALVARATNNGTEVLKRHGLTVADAGTSSQRLIDITKALQTQFGGAAEKAAQASGGTELLSAAYEDLEKKIGSKLAPTFDKIVKAMTDFFNFLSEHDEFATLAADIAVAALAIGGLATAAIAGTQAFALFRTAVIMLGLATAETATAMRLLVGSTGIGLLVVVVADLYLNWSTRIPQMQAIFAGFVTYIIGASKALGEIFLGILTFSPTKIKQGIDDWMTAFKNGWEEAKEKLGKLKAPTPETGTHEEEQDAKKAAAAAARQAMQDRADNLAMEKKRLQLELLMLEEANATSATLELKKQEIALLTQLEDTKNQAIFGLLEARLAHVREMQQEQYAVQLEQDDALNEMLLQHNQAYQQMDAQQRAAFLQKNKAQLEGQLITRRTTLQAAAKAEADIQIKAHNQFLLDQQKFGTAYAAINMAMHSAIFQGTKTAFGELAALQQSSNSTLKEIGKIAAISNIIIKTAESAMNIYNGFSIIPIVGPALGVVGAAAAVAFGAEQIGKVQGAAKGGVAVGGTPGIDSIPFMLQDQELVSPAQNFEEVIGSVAATRAAQGMGLGGGEETVELLKAINSQLSQNGGAGNTVIIQGDAIGDPAWVQSMAKALSNGLEFDNLKIFGLNTGKRFS